MIRHTLLALGLVAAAALPVSAAEYSADPPHSQARFTVVHLAFTKVHGEIPVTSAAITTGPGELPTSINATLNVAGIATGDGQRDSDMRSAAWFDTEKFPTMTFVSKHISGTPAAFTVDGDLTFHGVTKSVKLTGSFEGTMTDGKGRKHVAYTATTVVDRRDWGLNFAAGMPGGGLVVGNDATLDIEVDAIGK